MKLKFVRNHISIRKFDELELPEFAVITGLNGAGKTHLLKAIETGACQIDQISQNDVTYYNYQNFLVTNSASLNGQQIDSVRQQTWKYFNGTQGNPKVNWNTKISQLHNQFFQETIDGQRTDHSAIIFSEGHSIWDVYKNPDLVPTAIAVRVEQYVNAVNSQVFANPNFKKIPYHRGLTKALKKTVGRQYSIPQQQLSELFIPSEQSTDFLQTSLGVVFTKYLVDQFLWTHKEFDTGSNSASKNELITQYEETHVKPWVLMNEILEEIHRHSDQLVFDFKISEPSAANLNMQNWQAYAFTPSLINKLDNTPRQFDALSSGEKVLLALAISIYEAREDYSLPKILLLDEVDASLHPSMSKALIETIKSTFINRGSKVILATHSPSTVALAPESSVFVVQKGDVPNKVIPSSAKDALEILTEGYATLEEGVAVFNRISQHDFCIITEGRNSKYIKRALDLFGITDVAVINGLEAVTGKNELKTLYRLFCEADIAKPVLFIWDCDVTFSLKPKNSAYPLILPQNPENTICLKGIENMFPNHLFDSFLAKTIDSKGIETAKFDQKRKVDFESHVLGKADKSDFANFMLIVDEIERIRQIFQKNDITPPISNGHTKPSHEPSHAS